MLIRITGLRNCRITIETLAEGPQNEASIGHGLEFFSLWVDDRTGSVK